MRTSTRVLVALVSLWITTAAASSQDCPDTTLIQPDPHPSNSAYADPEVSGSCSGESFTVTSNGIPGYEFQQITPNALSAQNHSWTVPVAPDLPDLAEDVPLLGSIAFTTTGLPIFGPTEGPQPAAQAFGDPIFNGIVDFCNGHTAQRGDYHNHAILQECIGGSIAAGEASPILGYALDGFPIYGPTGCLDAACAQVVEFKSSWEQIADPTSDAWDAYEYVEKADETYLDECNGRVGSDGTFRYHATTEFPYVLGCYAGTDTLKATGGGGGTGGGGSAATGLIAFSRAAAIAGESLGTASIELTRTGGSQGALTASLTVVGGGAAATDYSLTQTSVTWEDGEQGSKTVDVALTNDTQVEPPEEVLVRLDVNAGTENQGPLDEMTLRIIDDDKGTPVCATSVDVICLNSDRFSVEAAWVDYDGNFGTGSSASFQTEDSGFFTFFDALNVELLVKVLDGCAVNGSRWVFGAGATDVGYVVTIADLQEGASYQFANNLSERSAAVADTEALPSSCP